MKNTSLPGYLLFQKWSQHLLTHYPTIWGARLHVATVAWVLGMIGYFVLLFTLKPLEFIPFHLANVPLLIGLLFWMIDRIRWQGNLNQGIRSSFVTGGLRLLTLLAFTLPMALASGGWGIENRMLLTNPYALCLLVFWMSMEANWMFLSFVVLYMAGIYLFADFILTESGERMIPFPLAEVDSSWTGIILLSVLMAMNLIRGKLFPSKKQDHAPVSGKRRGNILLMSIWYGAACVVFVLVDLIHFYAFDLQLLSSGQLIVIWTIPFLLAYRATLESPKDVNSDPQTYR
ncbi:hypothetical protein [Pontibacter sp. G13]|uniref:hypothetical protein n=1 Tax=Pontibacter sp. G13 TaxID=3074898 RepID=UPI00288B82F2|nr:hypothetical protein [Pontibacter sp. G13]WNJ16310.1 hypothetical protein RJD25_15710 [Pontibacter sp. G13]